MITQEFNYSRPGSLAEALKLIADGGKPLAGGMSLVPMMKLRLAVPEHLVDLGRIADLATITEDGGKIRIGAMVTYYAIESSPLLAAKCPLMVTAVHQIGDVQVRNVGTIGGSIAHADPAADWPASLLALEAIVHIQSAGGTRDVPMEEFLVDTFTTALEPGELLAAISVNADPAGAGSSYQKLVQPASGFAIVGAAAHVVRGGGTVTKCRIGITGVSGSAFRAKEAEAAIEAGKTPAEAVKGIASGVDANSDIHASAEYRKAMAEVYARRALESALA